MHWVYEAQLYITYFSNRLVIEGTVNNRSDVWDKISVHRSGTVSRPGKRPLSVDRPTFCWLLSWKFRAVAASFVWQAAFSPVPEPVCSFSRRRRRPTKTTFCNGTTTCIILANKKRREFYFSLFAFFLKISVYFICLFVIFSKDVYVLVNKMQSLA